MNDIEIGTTNKPSPLLATTNQNIVVYVPSGEDRFGEYKILGISHVAFKATIQESSSIFATEIILEQKGGPEKHLHNNQDEWFYALEGDLLIEAADEQFRMKPGASLFVKRRTPHVWANVGNTRMEFLATFTPGDNMDEFFVEAAKQKALPGPDPEFWRKYDMEWVGPPLKID